MNEEMVVQVLSDREEIVIELFNLLVLAQHLHILHLPINHLIKALN